jgi:peptidyl-tRNA hydrolase ICT1
VNKVNTKVDLRFNMKTVSFIPDIVKARLRERQQSRINKKDEFCISSDRHRTQNLNIEDCITKLYELIQESTEIPSETSKEKVERIKDFKESFNNKMMKSKKQRSSTKQHRKKDF